MEAVLIAFFGAVASFFTWRSKVHAKGARDDIATNHGKRPGEYLEMVGDVKNEQVIHGARLDALALSVGDIRENGSKPLADLDARFTAHVVQEAKDIAEVSRRLDQIEES